MDWLTGDLPGWLGAFLPLLVGGGTYAGSKRAALERARLDDRRSLIVSLRRLRNRKIAKWTETDFFQVFDTARQLPFLDRWILVQLVPERGFVENDPLFDAPTDDAMGSAISYFEWRVNPRLGLHWFLLKRRTAATFDTRAWRSMEILRSAESIRNEFDEARQLP